MVAQVRLDISAIDKFERRTLEKVKKFAFPLAIQGTLNTLAFDARKEAQEAIKRDFTLRNKYTERSILVTPTRTLKIADMVSVTGSRAPYMLAQEEGERKSSKGKRGLRIPAGAAAGQAQQFPRKGVLKKKFRRGQIKLANQKGKIRAMSRSQFILMSIRVAALRGQSPFVFLPFAGKRLGLYQIIPKGAAPPARYKRGRKSFSRKFKWGRPKGKPGMERLRFIHSYAHKTIVIKPTGWLKKNVVKVGGTMGFVFIKEADRVFDRYVK